MMIIASFVIVFIIQLVLCNKVNSRIIRFLPMIGFLLFGLYCVWGMIITPPGWDFGRLSYLMVAVYCVLQIALCGIVWGITALVMHKRRRKV